MKPIVLRKKSHTPIIVYEDRVYLPSNQTVSYLRVKLTTRSLIGEKQTYIKGVRTSSIVGQIKSRITPQDRLMKLDIILHDTNGRVIRCLKTVTFTDMVTVEKALNAAEVKPFLHLNQKVKG